MPESEPAPEPLERVLDTLRPDPTSGTAPYEQVRLGLAAAVADGRLPAGTRLPPVRTLAERLGLAAGTVARVYRELETDGVVRTEGRRGTFVEARAPRDAGTAAEVAAAAAAYAVLARRGGYALAEAQRLVEDSWSPR